MKIRHALWIATFLASLNLCAPAATLYVSLNSTNPVPPYASWNTAATNIQNAVDASTNGDLILVTNGVYAVGGRLSSDGTSNRVVVTDSVTIQSVNGQAVTLIGGDQSMRCIYLTNNAVLVGFTLTNGSAENGGGAYGASTNAQVSNCLLVNNTAGSGGGVFNCILNNCMLVGNMAAGEGGGAYTGILNGCTLARNQAVGDGGGAYVCILSNCTVTGNSVGRAGMGGGAVGGISVNCTFSENSAAYGGAIYGQGSFAAIANDCIISNNSAEYGGGVAARFTGNSSCILSNCLLIGNQATSSGGGAYYAALNNCNCVGNEAAISGGAAEDCTLNNCLLASNLAEYGAGADSSILDNCRIIGNGSTNSPGTQYGGGVENSTVNNSTLAGNVAAEGGAVDSSVLTNCVLRANFAGLGGGASRSTLYNSLLYANAAFAGGGGAEGGKLVNCTVVSNGVTASVVIEHGGGGGIDDSIVENSIVYYNYCFATNLSCSNWSPLDLQQWAFSCTTPQPSSVNYNITNAPQFMDLAGGNFRLQTNSPCINSAYNGFVVGSTDMDGRPRIIGGTVDMGAYEFQGPGMGEFMGWLQQYGLPTDGSVDNADLDGTGFSVYQDWIAGLNPTNALSVLAMFSPVPTNNPAGLVVSWESVSNRTYFLQSSTNLAAQPAFLTIQSNIVGQPNLTSFTDASATNAGPYFYRVGVQQ